MVIQELIDIEVMQTKEITRKAWEKLCARINESHHGSRVDIQLVRSDGNTIPVADDMPLRSVALDDKSDPCNDNLIIEAGLPDQKPIRHLIVEPIYIRLKDGTQDRYHHLHILAESGTTILTLHPGLSATVLNELEAD